MGCLEKQMPQDCKEFVDNVHIFIETTNYLIFGLPLHKLWRTKKWKTMTNALDGSLNYASGLVKEKIQEIERGGLEMGEETAHAELGMDFLTYMFYSGKMSIPEIAVNAVDLLLAGLDTTSLTMAACLYSLANNPQVQSKLRVEVQRAVGQDEMITSKHIHDMPYLRNTIKETMRLYPIAPNNSRILKEDVVLSGYKIPAGTYIVMSTIVAGRLAELFPEPEEFKPERWSRDQVDPPHSFSSLPFGFGRRMCVGRRVAELEMHILLAQLIRNLKIENHDKKPMEFVTKLFYGPGRQMDLTFVDI